MTPRSTFAVAALLALGAPSLAADRPTEAQRLEKLLAGRVAGKPVDCIRQAPTIDSSHFAGAIVYRDGQTYYLNRFDGGCPNLHEDDAIVTRTYSTRLCRGDIAQVVDPVVAMPRGSCIFASFTPYTRPK